MPENPDLHLFDVDDSSIGYEEFRFALPDRLLRSAIGIQLSDADASLLESRDDWAQTYFRQWSGEPAISDPGAPIALPRVVALAPALPRPTWEDVVDPEEEVVPKTPWWRSGHPAKVGAVTMAIGAVLGAALVLVAIPLTTAQAAPGTGTRSDPFPAGLDAHATSTPTPAPTSTASPQKRLASDVSAALRLDDRTAGLPGVSGVVQKEVVHVADVACIGGYQDSTAQQIATAVSGQPGLNDAAGSAVADAIARYCAATVG